MRPIQESQEHIPQDTQGILECLSPFEQNIISHSKKIGFCFAWMDRFGYKQSTVSFEPTPQLTRVTLIVCSPIQRLRSLTTCGIRNAQCCNWNVRIFALKTSCAQWKTKRMREAMHLLTKRLQVLSTIACMECQFTVWSNICTIYLLVAFMMINIGSKPVRRSEHKTSLSPSASNAFVCHGSSVSGSRKFCNSEARNLKCIKRRENPSHGHNLNKILMD